MEGSVTIRTMTPDDWGHVAAIYADGIQMRLATFETDVPSWEEWDRTHRPDCRLVAVDDAVVGWAALAPISPRRAYHGVGEVSVYVSASKVGYGIGGMLLPALIAASEEAGMWTLQASIFPENQVSIHLHTRCGFRVVGTRERVGQLDGVWRDVTFMERRAPA